LPELRRGDYRRLSCDPMRSVVVFARSLGREHVVVAMNASATRRTVKIPVADMGWLDGRIVRNLLDGEEFIVSGDSLTVTVPAVGGLWLK
ncbi:MAG: alpha-glucosidase C-terminal domain-containing protein, partial [Anaerolineaceae bacterium]